NIEKQESLLHTIVEDRRHISQLEPALAEARAKEKVLSESIQSQTAQREKQQSADKLVAEKAMHHNTAAAAKDQLQTQIQHIDTQRAIVADAQKKIHTNTP